MEFPRVVYYGPDDLQARVLAAYLVKLGAQMGIAPRLPDFILQATRAPWPLAVIADRAPFPTLLRIARAVAGGTFNTFPHVFILADGGPFDPHDPAIMVASRTGQLTTLVQHVLRLCLDGYIFEGEQFQWPGGTAPHELLWPMEWQSPQGEDEPQGAGADGGSNLAGALVQARAVRAHAQLLRTWSQRLREQADSTHAARIALWSEHLALSKRAMELRAQAGQLER